jgi:ElaB/YqjD/DUF883 family membrane-anchored ribosome-binding protein
MPSPSKTNGEVDITPDIASILQSIASLKDDVAKVTANATRDIGQSVSAGSGRAARAIGHQVEAQPLVSLALAFAAGLIGGRLLLR